MKLFAVAAVLLVSISSVLTTWFGSELRAPSTQPSSAYTDVASSRQYQAMGPQFVQARTDLVLSLEKKLDELSPESRKVLAENLLNIDEAIRELNAALEDYPDSGLLLHLLLSTYADQLTLLGTIDTIIKIVIERNDIKVTH